MMKVDVVMVTEEVVMEEVVTEEEVMVMVDDTSPLPTYSRTPI
jgi:hypothetical protein